MRRSTIVGSALAFVLVAAACQPAGPFTPTSSMHAARAGHTATLLTSGRVLVIGGAAAGQPSVERYDPGSGTWLVRAEMLTPRHGHRATRLSSGKVLVTGGRSTATGALVTAAELYDPANDRWTRAAGTPYPGGHSTALLPNGKVLAVFADDRTRGWLYDPVADAWSPTGPKHTIAWRTTTALPTGAALIVGGDTISPTEEREGFSRAELFDAETGGWSTTGLAPGHLVRQAASAGFHTVVAIGPALLREGSSAETAARVLTYDWPSGTWHRSTDATGCDNLHTAGLTLTGLEGESALVVGRHSCVNSTHPLAATVRLGDTTSHSGFAERAGHAAVRLEDGRVLITGGAFGHQDQEDPRCCPPDEVRATAELFSP